MVDRLLNASDSDSLADVTQSVEVLMGPENSILQVNTFPNVGLPFWPSAAESRDSLVESCTCRRCHQGTRPPGGQG